MNSNTSTLLSTSQRIATSIMRRGHAECFNDSWNVSKYARWSLALFSFFTFPFFLHAQIPAIDHVVVIGVDGMSPDGIKNATTPVMDSILKVAAYTFKCQAVLPTSSSPNWASMIMGAGPDKHGVTSNSWKPNKQTIELECEGTKRGGKPSGMWPTIYGELRRQKPDAIIACFNDWLAYNRLFEKGVVNRQRDANLLQAASHKGYKGITKKAARYFKKKKPDFMFVHLDHVDHAGHHDGHGTAAYYDAVGIADQQIGKIIQAIKESGVAERTIVLIVADHGGKGHGHGGDSPEEVNVPWILTGPSVVNGELQVEVKTYDTAATLAYLFGIEAPECWVGRAVIEAVAQ